MQLPDHSIWLLPHVFFFFLTWLSLPACNFTLTTALCRLYVWLELFLCCFLYTLFPFLFISCPRKILWLQNALPVRRLAGFFNTMGWCFPSMSHMHLRSCWENSLESNCSAEYICHRGTKATCTPCTHTNVNTSKKKKISNLHCGLEPWSAMLPLWHHRNRPRSFWDTITPRMNWLANVPYIL